MAKLRQQFADQPEAAKQLLQVGHSKRDEAIDPVEHAAYTALCITVLNLDETLSKRMTNDEIPNDE